MPDALATIKESMMAPRQSSDQDLIDQLVAAAPNFANSPVIDQMTATAQRSNPQTVDDFIKMTMEAHAR